MIQLQPISICQNKKEGGVARISLSCAVEMRAIALKMYIRGEGGMGGSEYRANVMLSLSTPSHLHNVAKSTGSPALSIFSH